MKKVLVLMMLAVMSISASAQSQNHLKFQGIPIDGTFAQFEAKLKAKGWKYDVEESRGYDVDTRLYKGTFAGNKGELHVFRSPNSKVVFGVSFYQDIVYSKEIVEQQVARHIEAVRRAYPNAYEWVKDDGSTQFDLDNGMIICSLMDYHDYRYCTNIAYIDKTNQEKYLNEIDSDY